MQELQHHTSILQKVPTKVIQFLRIFLFYVLKFYFCLLKLNKILGVKVFQHTYLYTAHADDTTFFWKIGTLLGN